MSDANKSCNGAEDKPDLLGAIEKICRENDSILEISRSDLDHLLESDSEYWYGLCDLAIRCLPTIRYTDNVTNVIKEIESKLYLLFIGYLRIDDEEFTFSFYHPVYPDLDEDEVHNYKIRLERKIYEMRSITKSLVDKKIQMRFPKNNPSLRRMKQSTFDFYSSL